MEKRCNKKLYLVLAAVILLAAVVFGIDASKPRVGVSWPTPDGKECYIESVKKAGGKVVLLPYFNNEEEAETYLKKIDAVVVTGGADVDVALYNEEPHEKLEEIDHKRDISDIALLKACMALDMPTIGTCRGMQMTNVLCGGALYQDLPSQNPTDIIHRDPKRENFVYHDVTIEPDNIVAEAWGEAGTFEVNSWHHQAIKRLGNNIKAVAFAPDGIVEAIIKTDQTYFIGLQWHPEELVPTGNEHALNFYKSLVEAGKKYHASK